MKSGRIEEDVGLINGKWNKLKSIQKIADKESGWNRVVFYEYMRLIKKNDSRKKKLS